MAKEKAAVDHTAISGTPAKNAGAQAILEKFAGEPAKEAVERATPVPVAASPAASRSPLETIHKGKVAAPPRILLYGQEGIGKSTLIAQAPKAIFVDTEQGLEQINCNRFPMARTLADVERQLESLIAEPHDYSTLGIDSADWLEKLIWQRVCEEKGKNSIEDIGFAKGYIFALEWWRKILARLDALRARGMAIILIAHAKVEKFEDPETATYDRYSPRLHKHATALLTEWADAVLFATRKFTLRVMGEGTNERQIALPVGANGGERVLRCVGSAACMAKNRYGMPAEIPLSWNDLMDNLMKGM